MKKRVHMRFAMLFTLLCAMTLTSHANGPVNTVLWHNLSDGSGGKNPGVTEDVYDENIDIIGVNALVEGIKVVAQNHDIVITVTDGDSVITGSGNRCDGMPTDPARLYLYAAEDRTITFSLCFDLTFRGTANGDDLLDLMVTVSGPGTVQFFIKGDKEVCFTSQETSGGTQVFVALDEEKPTLKFQRFHPLNALNASEEDLDISVKIGPDSCISYIGENPVANGIQGEFGCIVFDPSNTGTGCTFLRIENCGSLVIFGHWLNASLDSEFTLTNIDLATPAGTLSQFKVENAFSDEGTPASLQVLNKNCVMPNLLSDPFCDDSFTGTQCGFILGANGQIELDDITYLDYIGLKNNLIPDVQTPIENVQKKVKLLIDHCKITGPKDMIKFRNPSAFFVDGSSDPNAVPAKIIMNGSSAIYFRSGVDKFGNCVESVREPIIPGLPCLHFVKSFTIDPCNQTKGAGEIVFDVEGELDVCGDPDGDNGLSVLSLYVTKTGCPVFVESDPENNQFPQRTFRRDVNGDYLQYNKAAFLINDRMNIRDASIIHTDQNHHVFERDHLGRPNLSSEPTYIGGEKFCVCLPEGQPRPTIALYDSIFRIHTNAGLTGVDVRVPNDCNEANISAYRFYANGRKCDNGYGRTVVNGTDAGSLSGCGQLIDKDSHLDIFQEKEQANPTAQNLRLETGLNDACIKEGLTQDISGQCSVHSIFLGNGSNISVGTNGSVGTAEDGTQFELTTSPMLCISGDFFAFETEGGNAAYPEASGTTGQGGIFVDMNGKFKIDDSFRASIATMVVRSRNGIVDLPKSQVFFDLRVGIAQWNVDLGDPDQRVLVSSGECLSDFTMDWGAVTKDYCSSDSFVPYEPKMVPNPCECPAVTDANLRALPCVAGEVDQFQIKRSRIGDQAHLKVTGKIRELVFLTGCNAGEAPVGFIDIEQDGFVGLGSAHRNVDSLQASIVLGINGVTLCANGTGIVELNEDILVNNVCHFVTGTSFGVNGPQTLTIHSHVPREFRVKSTGVLDLTMFDNPNKILEFAGEVRMVFEPGARIAMNGGVLKFIDNTEITFERILDIQQLNGSVPADLDPVRVKMFGKGTVIMEEFAEMNIVHQNIFGIETACDCFDETDITWILKNQAKINVGSDGEPGGAFQIGDTCCEATSVNFSLILDGPGTLFQINRRGFFGIGVGMANEVSDIPSNWLVNCLENVNTVSIDIQEGTFQHSQIFSTDEDRSSVFAIGPAESLSFQFDRFASVILGGGNLILLENCINDECDENSRSQFEMDSMAVERMLDVVTEQCEIDCKKAEMVCQAREMIERAQEMMQQAEMLMKTGLRSGNSKRRASTMIKNANTMVVNARKIVRNLIISSVNPIVRDFAGQVTNNLEVGLMSGKLLLVDNAKPIPPVGVGPQAFFDYLKVLPHSAQLSPRANIARDQLNVSRLGYIFDGSSISRQRIQRILAADTTGQADHDHSLRIGAVSININDTNGDLNATVELRGAGAR